MFDFLFTLLFRRKKAAVTVKPRSAHVGEWGEDVAADFLTRNGFQVLGRNVRPDRRDELDIIAKKGKTLVFAEVKTRRREDFGRPMCAVDKAKRRTLNRAAAAYLRRAKYPNLFYRFDVIEVLGQPEDPAAPTIRHIEDAFPFEGQRLFPI